MSLVLEKTKSSGQGRYTVENLLGIETADNLKLAEKVEAGFSFGAFERLGKTTGLSLERLRVAVRITPRTLTRRRKEKKLSPEESDRLVSVSRLLAQTFELFEDNAEAGMLVSKSEPGVERSIAFASRRYRNRRARSRKPHRQT